MERNMWPLLRSGGMYAGFLLLNLKEIGHLEGLGVDGE
jgi:hypothetical protein